MTDVRPLQPLNASSPMLVTELPIVREVRPLQPSNAYFPMLVTELPIVREVRLLQFLNTSSPMFVTDVRHGVADGDGGQTAASTVFVYNCVSMPSKLNGRKVTRKYMRIAEKIKI